MADVLFVGLQDEDRIASFAIDAATGALTRQEDIAVAGGPSVLALSPDRRGLFVGTRRPAGGGGFRVDPPRGGPPPPRGGVACFGSDHGSGALAPRGSVAAADAPPFLAPAPPGRYLLSAYYQGGYA